MRKALCGFAIGVLALAACSVIQGTEQDEMQALISKAIKATGGDAKVALLRAGTLKGKVGLQENGLDISVALDASWQGWDQYRIDGEVSVNNMTQRGLLVINGGKGWIKDANKTTEIPNNVFPVIKEIFTAVRMPHMLPALKEKEFKLSPLGEIKIGDRAAVGMVVARKDYKDVNLYFDKENGLPLKSEVRVADPNGQEMSIEYSYRDYKEVGGLKHPTRVLIKADGKELTLELSDLQPQGKLDAGLFVQP